MRNQVLDKKNPVLWRPGCGYCGQNNCIRRPGGVRGALRLWWGCICRKRGSSHRLSCRRNNGGIRRGSRGCKGNCWSCCSSLGGAKQVDDQDRCEYDQESKSQNSTDDPGQPIGLLRWHPLPVTWSRNQYDGGIVVPAALVGRIDQFLCSSFETAFRADDLRDLIVPDQVGQAIAAKQECVTRVNGHALIALSQRIYLRCRTGADGNRLQVGQVSQDSVG